MFETDSQLHLNPSFSIELYIKDHFRTSCNGIICAQKWGTSFEVLFEVIDIQSEKGEAPSTSLGEYDSERISCWIFGHLFDSITFCSQVGCEPLMRGPCYSTLSYFRQENSVVYRIEFPFKIKRDFKPITCCRRNIVDVTYTNLIHRWSHHRISVPLHQRPHLDHTIYPDCMGYNQIGSVTRSC